MDYNQRLAMKHFVDVNKTDYPSFAEACKLAAETGQGIIYACRNFFCVVWYECGLRCSRDLKNWGIKGEFLPQVRTAHAHVF